jgi:hypothetical protein
MNSETAQNLKAGDKVVKEKLVATVLEKKVSDNPSSAYARLQVDGFPSGTDKLCNVLFGWEPKALKPVKAPKPTSVQLAIAANPCLFEQVVEHYKRTGRIEITCQPSRIDSEADRLSQVSSLSPMEAAEYIKPTTEASHSAKYDIIVSDDIPEPLQQFIGTFFKKGLRSGTGEFQINSRSLAEYLMQNHGALPVRCFVVQ